MNGAMPAILSAFTVCGLFRRNGAHDVRPGVLRVIGLADDA